MKYISTTALAKNMKVNTGVLFAKLLKLGWLEGKPKEWVLTPVGVSKGGVVKKYTLDAQPIEYIAWPENIKEELEKEKKSDKEEYITVTNIAKYFEISRNRVNPILSELGWIEKGKKGWLLTELGKQEGGVQDDNKKSGKLFVRWPESILYDDLLQLSVDEIKGIVYAPAYGFGFMPHIGGMNYQAVSYNEDDDLEDSHKEEIDFRKKFPAEKRTKDGHYVRSKSEVIIDNWLYVSQLVHAYERKIPIREDIICDFYIPKGQVYIEYWGYDSDSPYLARKKKKQEIYRKYNLNLIELEEKDVANIDDVLPRKLLDYDISVDYGGF
ncbi:glycerol kinase [Chloroflexota bacterium]